MGIQNQYVNYLAYLNYQTYKLQLYKMYYKINREVVPQYFTTVIPTLTHNYFTRRTADQRNRTYCALADRKCLHAMIDLLNKSPLIKAQVTTGISLPHFVSFVKQQCFRHYEYFCNVNVKDCYVCNGNEIIIHLPGFGQHFTIHSLSFSFPTFW